MRRTHFIAVVGVLLIGCAVLVVAGCSGMRSESPKEEEQGKTEATKGQARSPEATASEEARCGGTRTVNLLKEKGVGAVADSSVQPGDPEARYITNDMPSCPAGGLLSGTDRADRLAGEEGEDEVRGLGGSDRLSGGLGRDVIYGGPGDDELQSGGMQPLVFYTDRSKNTLYGGPGRDFLSGDEGDEVLYGGDGDDGMLYGAGGEDVLYGGDGNDHLDASDDGHRDKLYCGEGKDDYFADKLDYVDSTCKTSAPEGGRPAAGRGPVGGVPDYNYKVDEHSPVTKTEERVLVTTQAQSESDLEAIAIDIAKQDNKEYVYLIYEHPGEGFIFATAAAFMSAEAYKDWKDILALSRQLQQEIERKGFPYVFVYYGPKRGVG